MRIILLIALYCVTLLIAFPAFGDKKPEAYYRDKWCLEHKGRAEYGLLDNTRVDCLTDDYAVEFDFAPKWAEALGQSMHYAYMTGRKGAIALLIRKRSKTDRMKAKRIRRLISYYRLPLKLFIIEIDER